MGDSIKKEFPIWKTIKLGLCKDVESYYHALLERGYKLNVYAEGVLNEMHSKGEKFEQETELDLVKVTPRQFGIREKDPYYYDWVCEKGLERGLQLCPGEVGLALRLAHETSPGTSFEWLGIAMKTRGGYYRTNYKLFFIVRLELGKVCLYAGVANPVTAWGPNPSYGAESEYIFVRPRS